MESGWDLQDLEDLDSRGVVNQTPTLRKVGRSPVEGLRCSVTPEKISGSYHLPAAW